MLQNGVPIQSIDDAKRGRGDVVDTLGRVLFRDTLHGWLWCGEHRGVSDALRVMR